MDGSRKISGKEYLKQLQLEYLSHKLREAIYKRPEFIKMSREIAEKKKDKILEISKKFQTPCLFDSETFFSEFCEREFFQQYGLPNFQYNSNPVKSKAVAYWDAFYLLAPGTEIVYKDQVYRVDGNDPDAKYIQVIVNGEFALLAYVEVKIKGLKALLDKTLK